MSLRTYHIVKSIVKDKKFAWLKARPSTIQQPWNLTRGIPMGGDFPSDVEIPVDPKWGDFLPDFIPNTFNVLIVSARVREILDSEEVGDIEYLPFVILDKKGRPKSTDYAVANVLGTVDCLDAQNSVYRDDELEPGQIIGIQRLNVLSEQITRDKKLFRLAQKRNLFVIRADLRQRFLDEQTTGFDTFDMNEPVFIIS